MSSIALAALCFVIGLGLMLTGLAALTNGSYTTALFSILGGLCWAWIGVSAVTKAEEI